MDDKQPSKWSRLPKLSFSSKELSRRMKKVEGATVKHARRFVFRRMDNIKEVRRHIALWVLTIGVIIGASGLQLMWYQQSYRQVANAVGGTYAEAVLGPVNTLNPIFASTSAEEAVGRLLFARLLTYDETGHLHYDLADSMQISKDKKTYTLKIRPDARWQDGIYVRARDVVFTVNLLKDPATRSTIAGWDGVEVEAIDDQTVSFTLPAVYAAFPHALNDLPILPEHTLRNVEPSAIRENNFSSDPVASGPFELRFIQDIDSANGRKVIYLAQNDSYFGGVAKLDRFQLHVYADAEDIVKAINTGEVNGATDITFTDTIDVNRQRAVVKQKPINEGVYAFLNTTSPVLKDKTLRQALQRGTDTQAIRQAIGGDIPGLSLPFISGQLSGKVPNAPAYSQSEAGKLLDKAGWKLSDDGLRKKKGQALTLSVVTTKNKDLEKALDVLAGQWQALGVTVTTTIIDPSDPSQNIVQNVLQPRNYDVLVYQLSIGGDPDVYAYWHSSQASSGLNFSNYADTVSDEALTTARSRLEPSLRNAKYITFAKQWLSDVPAIGLYQVTAQYVHSKSIHTIGPDEVLVSTSDRYANVLYWSVGERIVHQTP